jgi:hypothetical protein
VRAISEDGLAETYAQDERLNHRPAHGCLRCSCLGRYFTVGLAFGAALNEKPLPLVLLPLSLPARQTDARPFLAGALLALFLWQYVYTRLRATATDAGPTGPGPTA